MLRLLGAGILCGGGDAGEDRASRGAWSCHLSLLEDDGFRDFFFTPQPFDGEVKELPTADALCDHGDAGEGRASRCAGSCQLSLLGNEGFRNMFFIPQPLDGGVEGLLHLGQLGSGCLLSRGLQRKGWC